MTYIKPDPETQEEQEDLIMSYLNADYLSTEATPLSPPSSTSSASDTTGSPEKHSVDDFMLDINTTDFLNNNDHWTSNPDLFNPCFPQQPQMGNNGGDFLGGFPFFLSSPSGPVLNSDTNFIQPFLPPMSSSSSTGSNSDTEQPKKKRGRKKREAIVQNTLPVQPSLLAPKPLAPRPNSEIIKMEPTTTNIEVAGPQQPQITTTTTNPIQQTSSSSSLSLSPPPPSQEAQKAAQIQKRQERLIKNRAAALLSRKRKREHLTCLEEEKQLLVTENENLLNKVATLESKVAYLEKENLELKQHLQVSSNNNNHNQNDSSLINLNNNKRSPLVNTKSSKATGVVFMIMLFSFALFTLPSRTADRLTVGGSVMDTKKQFPLIGSSHHVDYSMVNNNNSTTDLVLIDAVRPRDLQTWINHKADDTNDIQAWSNGEQPTQRHVYLYSKEFSQIAPIQQQPQFTSTADLPILSLISPYNTTDGDGLKKDCEQQKYLKIDVQVLRSTVITSQLLPLQQCDATLFDGLKNDLITNQNYIQQNANVTPSIIVKREKRAKKLSRVIA